MSLRKTRVNTLNMKFFGLAELPNVTLRDSTSGYAVELGGGELVALGGKNDGCILDDGIIQANSRAILRIGTLRPDKYHTLLEVNPALDSFALIGSPTILEPDETVELNVVVSAFRQVNLNELDWVVRLYQMS